MKYSLLSILALLFSPIANATPIERILLKDGSVLEGHIVSQVPGKTMVFQSEVSTIVLSGDHVNIVGTVEDEVENTSDAWQEWAKEHKEALMQKGSKSFLKLSDISINTYQAKNDSTKKDSIKNATPKNILLNNVSPGRVKILMRGANVKYVDVAKREYTISYKDIAEIQKVLRKKDVISGTVDIIETTDGRTLAGQIVSQKLGESVQILCDDTQEIEDVPVKQLKEQKKQKLNPNQDLFEQVQYLDVISSKGKNEVKGVIINQHVNSDKEGNFIHVKTSDDNLERIQNNEITSIRKEQNPSYKEPLTDIIIENDSIYLCRVSALKITSMEYDDKTRYVEVEKDSVAFTISRKDMTGNKLVVECYNTKDNSGMILVPVYPEALKIKKDKKEFYTFTYKSLSESAVKPASDPVISPNNTLRYEYTLGNGVYVIYRQSDKICILFEIKE